MTNTSFAVLSSVNDAPLASFSDLPTALAWGFQRLKSEPFVIRENAHGPTEEEQLQPEAVRFLTKVQASEEVMAAFERHEQGVPSLQAPAYRPRQVAMGRVRETQAAV